MRCTLLIVGTMVVAGCGNPGTVTLPGDPPGGSPPNTSPMPAPLDMAVPAQPDLAMPPAASVDDYYPVATGKTWTMSDGIKSVVFRVGAPVTVDGRAGFEFIIEPPGVAPITTSIAVDGDDRLVYSQEAMQWIL